MTEYVGKLFQAGEKDTHRLTVCGLTYLRELDGSKRSGQGRLYRALIVAPHQLYRTTGLPA